MRMEDKHGLRKREHSRTGHTLAEAPGAAAETEKKGLPAAEVAGHKPGPDGNHLHHGSGDLHSAGRTNVKGGEDDDGSGV